MLNIEKRDAIHDRVLKAVTDSASEDELCKAIEQMSATDGNDVYSSLLSVLASVDFDADLSKELWERAMEHGKSIASSLNRPVGIFVALHDLLTNIEVKMTRPKIIELALYNKIEKSAVTDGLTGLHNYAHFREELGKEIEQCTRYGSCTSLIIFDLDNFKRFNDTYGHQSGDMALKAFAAVMKEKTRAIDIVARYGGEEFVCVLPMTNTKGALLVAERIRKAIENRDIATRSGNPAFARVTCSGGIVTLVGRTMVSAEQLIDKADRALYRAKEEGKNRIVVSSFENREHFRIEVPILLSYSTIDKQDEAHAVKIINFGWGGVLFRCTERFDIFSLIRLELSIPDIPNEKMKALGKVVRTKELEDGQVDVAVQFLDIKQQDRNRIYRVLFGQRVTHPG
jgi:diguanylate cyclase (GGDEF)-like protein